MKSLFALLCCLLCVLPLQAQGILYVDASASGASNGTSWADAFVHLQDALAAAESGDEIWVAAGVYRPDQGAGVVPGDREATFELKSGVALYGGFAGGEMALEERDWEANETILSGDLLGNDNDNVALDEPTRAENSYHVLLAPEQATQILLDGFTITAGQADGLLNRRGGGLFISFDAWVEIANSVFIANLADWCGGGMLSYSSFLIKHTQFYDNVAADAECSAGGGGAIYHYQVATTGGQALPIAEIHHAHFENNRADVTGGALAVFTSPYIMTHSVFVSNRSDNGGAVFNSHVSEAPIAYANVAFYNNSAFDEGGGAIYNESSTLSMSNAVFSGNTLDPTTNIGGIAIQSTLQSVVSIFNSTFANNSAALTSVLYSTGTSYTALHNSILWNDRGEPAAIRIYDANDIMISHSIVQAGLPVDSVDAGGNLTLDPLFVDADGEDNIPGTLDDDLRLLRGSPAIDVGDNTLLPADSLDLDEDDNFEETIPLDLDGNLRTFDGGSGAAVVDIGAYEFGSSLVGVSVRPQHLRSDFSLAAARPNPFNPETTLAFALPKSAEVRLAVYDLLGREVALLVDGRVAAGRHTAQFDATGLPSGTYVYRLATPAGVQVRTMVLLR